MNGFSTLNENIADNVGLKAAYHAYVKGLNASEPEKRLPGLNFSPKQMFWISMANSLCGRYRGEYLKTSVYEERISPYKFRVNGPASNLPEFANDFQCNREAKMNPAKKCDLWNGFSEPIAKLNK